MLDVVAESSERERGGGKGGGKINRKEKSARALETFIRLVDLLIILLLFLPLIHR